MPETPKSFAELSTISKVNPDDLLATLKNYAESGAAISGATVVRIISLTQCTHEQLEDLLNSALRGVEYHQQRRSLTEAGEYQSVATFINSKIKSAVS